MDRRDKSAFDATVIHAEPAAPDQLRARLKRLDRIADGLDTRFSVLGIKFGWDAILGLLPGVGDFAAMLPGAYIIYEGYNVGARKRVIGRMCANSAVDFALGSVPVLGNVFDLFFKDNRRNIGLLRQEMARLKQDRTLERESIT